MNKLTIITGQTATGKTEKAIQLATEHNGELINCDSRQIYKYLDIISGKDLTNNDYHEQKRINNHSIGYYNFDTQDGRQIPIWLYDIILPNQPFSSFEFQELALPLIQDIWRRGKVPIIVGGTYFYLKHLLYDMVKTHVPPNEELRKELDTKSVSDLQKQLAEINPDLFESLNKSDKQNPRRLMRKIEISLFEKDFKHEDETLTFRPKLKDAEIEYIGLQYKDKNRELASITARVEKRLRQDAFGEVQSILDRGYTEDDPGMQTIGYQQILHYLKGRISKEEAVQQWITKEIQYAKRQFTFMKKDPHVKWQEV